MSLSFKYWDDCVDPEDMELLWKDGSVSKEWIDANERKGQKVHLSRDPDGQPYLTQTEMRAVAEIIVERHFKSQIDPVMICALAEILSDRQILAEEYDKNAKEVKLGIMQMLPTTADWLVRVMGYKKYNIQDSHELLCKPFTNVYFGAAYIKWLSNHDGKERSEEYVIRAYKGGVNKATHKSTMNYFQRYLFVKDSLLPKSVADMSDFIPDALSIDAPYSFGRGDDYTYWDLRVSHDDMEEMWRYPAVLKEWRRTGERRGRVRFSQDKVKRPYLSRVEVKAVAQIIIQRHFSSRGIRPTALAALAEVCSMRFVNGVRARTGLMGIDYPTAKWLYRDIGRREYRVNSVDDLYSPFVSMYFGAAYLDWLSEYEGRQRSHEFVIQAYLGGPENVNLQETGPLWKKFRVALSYYEDPHKIQWGCCIL